MTRSRSERNCLIIQEFRANGGKVAEFAETPLLLLTTTGAKSGQKRENPVVYLADGDRSLVLAANAGRRTHPSWYHDLVAHPDVTVEVGTEHFAARAIGQGWKNRLNNLRLMLQPYVSHCLLLPWLLLFDIPG